MKSLIFFLISTQVYANVYGTKSRTEVETKLSFTINKEIDTQQIAIRLREKLEKELLTKNNLLLHFSDAKQALKAFDKNKKIRNKTNELNGALFINALDKISHINKQNHVLKSEKYLSKKVRISPQVTSFVFEDTYFDSKQYELYNQNALYRLRYRFKGILTYKLYELLKMKPFYPNRCEIQSKVSSKQETNYFSTKEARFEFRDESPPFNKENNPAPPAPWKKSKFIKIAKTGLFSEQIISPMDQIKKAATFSQLTPQVRLVTKRERFHLYLPNPWGSGPNPSQLFIFSFDHVSVNCLTKECRRRNPLSQFYEFEIEIDRNTYRNVSLWSQDIGDSSKILKERINNKSRSFKMALESDLDFVSNIIHQAIRKMLPKAKFKEPISKYQRVFL